MRTEDAHCFGNFLGFARSLQRLVVDRQFWTQCDGSTETDKLHHDVVSFIDHYAQRFADRDIFTIILIGHDSCAGIQLGNKLFKYENLVDRLERFQTGIRLNIILQSCQSGSFVNNFSARGERKRFVHTSVDPRSPSGRYRNSKFSGAFLESLGFAQE